MDADKIIEKAECIDMGDDMLMAISKTPVECADCGEEFLIAEVYESAFQGVFVGGKRLPLCKICFNKW